MTFEKTKKCLKAAITGEFNATLKYSEFSKVAAKEGHKNIAYLFQTLVVAENIHIKNHKRALGEDYSPESHDFDAKSTSDNVQAGIEGETYEFTEMYPGFLKEFQKETKEDYGKVAKLSMEWASKVEITHAEILKMALAALESGNDLKIDALYICRVCGNIILGEPKELCPVCGHDIAFYQLVPRKELN
jgi:rubrerythrin